MLGLMTIFDVVLIIGWLCGFVKYGFAVSAYPMEAFVVFRLLGAVTFVTCFVQCILVYLSKK